MPHTSRENIAPLHPERMGFAESISYIINGLGYEMVWREGKGELGWERKGWKKKIPFGPI